jgi:glutaredoxin-related protein
MCYWLSMLEVYQEVQQTMNSDLKENVKLVQLIMTLIKTKENDDNCFFSEQRVTFLIYHLTCSQRLNVYALRSSYIRNEIPLHFRIKKKI